jgi:hypothetical protein
MKTPRQVLLDRHADAQASLDALRQSVVTPMRQRRRPWRELLWQELVLPIRPLLAGLAVAWALILALHLSSRGASTERVTHALPPSFVREVAAQQRILTALLGLRPAEAPEPAEPRSERPPSGNLHRRHTKPLLQA